MTYANVKARLFAIAQSFEGSDPARPALNAVMITPAKNHGAIIVGTNGHALICIHDKDAVVSKPMSVHFFGISRYLIRRLGVDSGADLVFGLKYDGAFSATIVRGRHNYALVDGEMLPEHFDGWRKVVSKFIETNAADGKPAAVQNIYVKKMAVAGRDLRRFAGLYSNDIKLSCMSCSGSNEPVFIRWPDIDFAFGFIMPTNIEIDWGYPQFILDFLQQD